MLLLCQTCVIWILRDFLEGSFEVDIIERQHDTVDSDSDISLDEDISDGADHDENDFGGGL